MMIVEETMQKLKTLCEKLRQDIDNEIVSFISRERASIISNEDVSKENANFLQTMKASLTNEFAKEVFDLVENKESTWGINPTFFEQNSDLEDLMHGKPEKIKHPMVNMQQLFSISPWQAPERCLSDITYCLMYVFIPISGLAVLGSILWGINCFFPFIKF